MIKRVVIFCLVICSHLYAQKAWQYVHNNGEISIDNSGYQTMVFSPSGIPYLTYMGIHNIAVAKYDGTQWVQVGNITPSGVTSFFGKLNISPSGIPYLATAQTNSLGNFRLKVYSFNGSNWMEVGDLSTLTPDGDAPSIIFGSSGEPYLSFTDGSLDQRCTVLKYNGSAWELVGSRGMTNAQPGWNQYSFAISSAGVPYVAYSDNSNGRKATVVKYDGNSWVSVGSPMGLGATDGVTIAISPTGVPHVSFDDYANTSTEVITVMKFDGNNWVTTGNNGIVAGTAWLQNIAFASSGVFYLAHDERSKGNTNSVLSYDGSNWATVGGTCFGQAGSSLRDMQVNPVTGEPWVMYVGAGTKSYVMKYSDVTCGVSITGQIFGSVDFAEGSTASVNVVASGGTDLQYKWKKNGVYVSGATSATYSIPSVTIANAGVYVCEVSDHCGTSVLSQPVNLSVNVAPQYKVMAWGGNNAIQNIPAGLTGSNAIVSGIAHAAALKPDGTVAVWGYNDNGMLNIPAGLTGVKSIAAQGFQTIVSKNDGTVVQWGASGASVPAGLTGVSAVSAGNLFGAALKNDGTVVTWGDNTLTAVAAGLTNVLAISAGASHIVALKNDGSVVAWGNDYYGQVTGANGVTGVKSIYARSNTTTLFMQDGTVRQFGENVYSGITGSANLKDVSSNLYHTLAINQNGLVDGYGGNYFGEINIPAGLAGVKAVSAGGNGSSGAAGYPDFSIALYLINLMSGGGIYCSGTPQPVYINLAGVSPWSVTYTEDGVTKTVNNIQYSPYTVSLAANNAIAHTYQLVSVTDANGTKSVSAGITTTPASPGSVTSQSPASAATICGVTPYTLSVAATGATGYQWRKGGVAIAGANASSYTISNPSPANAGSYDCQITDLCGTPLATTPVTLTVTSIPTIANFTDDYKSSVNKTYLKTLNIDLPTAVSDWYWGTSYSNYAGQSSFLTGTMGFVTGKAKTNISNFKVISYVPGCPNSNLVSYYTPADSNPNREGIEETGWQSYLYPNPASSSFTVNSEAEQFKISIFNMLGDEVLSKTAAKGGQINIQSLSNGIYTVRIIDAENTTVKKLEVLK